MPSLYLIDEMEVQKGRGGEGEAGVIIPG